MFISVHSIVSTGSRQKIGIGFKQKIDQTVHKPSLIRVFAVHMKKAILFTKKALLMRY